MHRADVHGEALPLLSVARTEKHTVLPTGTAAVRCVVDALSAAQTVGVLHAENPPVEPADCCRT